MKTEKNILIAFILNLAFSLFEFAGGMFTGSIAIATDAFHDLGDAVSVGISYFCEKKGGKKPDNIYTFGYARYSLIGGLITTVILLLGSVIMIYKSTYRLISPTEINYSGMIVFAIVGVCVNLCAAFLTHGGKSLNQKAVNLHMLEDVLGWGMVLIGAIVMHFTDLSIIDPLISIGVSAFILLCACKNIKEIFEVFLEKAPQGIDINEIQQHVCELDGVTKVHNLHIWNVVPQICYATMHVVANGNFFEIKESIREILYKYGIVHVTIEMEYETEISRYAAPDMEYKNHSHHHHH